MTNELLFPEQINVKCGYGGGQKLHFYFRMISIAEESQYMQRFLKMTENADERSKAEYRAILDGMKEWSIKPPTVESDGKHEPLADGNNAAEVLENFFGEYTVAKERMLHTVMLEFRAAMQPPASFF